MKRPAGTKLFLVYLLLLTTICVLFLHETFTTYIKEKLTVNSSLCSNKSTSRKVHVLLLSYARTGSTFAGDLLQSHPSAFYHFEPLRFLTSHDVTYMYPNSTEILHKLFHCQMSSIKNLAFPKRQYLAHLKRNVRLWKECSPIDSCYNETFIDDYCSVHNMVVIKTIKLDLVAASRLFLEYPEMNLKIVYLARDPRGTVNSRMKSPVNVWCEKEPICVDPSLYCSGLMNDSKVACELLSTRPKDFTIVRYEDLSRQPLAVTRRLVKFMGLEMTKEMKDFLKGHTTTARTVLPKDNRFAYTTFRDSLTTSTKWREDLPIDKIFKTQDVCHLVLDWLGYYKYATIKDLKSKVNFDRDLDESIKSYCPREINV